MEIIVKPEKKDITCYYQNNIRNVLLPLENFSVEYNSYFSLDEIKNIQKKYPDIHIFVSMNKNFFNHELQKVETILKELENMEIFAILFYDLSILQLKKKLNLNIPLVWNQTHMVTNYKTCDYYYEQGVEYGLLSKEITLEEIEDIIKKSKMTPIVELISKPVIGFSKRKLITNYYQDLNKSNKDEINIQERVSNTNLIVKENSSGTFFVKDSIVNGALILDSLIENNLKYILLKEDYIKTETFLDILRNVDYYISHYKDLTKKEKNEWLEKQKELIGEDSSFFFQKTIYKVK